MTYDDLMNPNVLLDAFNDCRKNVSWKYSVQNFSLNRFAQIDDLIQKLKNRDFSFPEYEEFDIMERGKKRHIKAVSMQERVLQKALCKNYLNPLLSKGLIYDNSSTIKGKGTSFARKQIVKHLRTYFNLFGGDGYVLQIDFKNYFASIDHDVLFNRLESKIKDSNIFDLLKFLIKKSGEIGLGIGSELSQILAVWFPNELDHFCKEVLRLKFYGRYMDDIYVIHTSKLYLQECLEKIRIICENLKIKINENKTKITNLKKGFRFLKIRYKFTTTGHILKIGQRDSCKRIRHKFLMYKNLLDSDKISIKEIKDNYKSWRNTVKHFDCYKLIRQTDSKFNKIFGGF